MELLLRRFQLSFECRITLALQLCLVSDESQLTIGLQSLVLALLNSEVSPIGPAALLC